MALEYFWDRCCFALQYVVPAVSVIPLKSVYSGTAARRSPMFTGLPAHPLGRLVGLRSDMLY